MSGLNETSLLKVYSSKPSKGLEKILSKDAEGKKKIKLKLSILESGTYNMTYSENKFVGETILIIK